MTSTQKTPWAEFLWRTLAWRKSLTHMTLTQKTPWAEFIWAKRLHKEKSPGYHGNNTEDSMGTISMGETSAQEEKPWLSWHQHRRLRGQNSYGRTLAWRKFLTLMTLTQKTLWAELIWAERSHEEKTQLYWHQHGRFHGQKSLWEKRLYKKKNPALMTSTWGNTMGHPVKSCGTSLEKSMEFLWAESLWNLWNLMGHLMGNS